MIHVMPDMEFLGLEEPERPATFESLFVRGRDGRMRQLANGTVQSRSYAGSNDAFADFGLVMPFVSRAN